MNAILQQYWQSLLWTNGYQLSGLAMTLWLLVFSMVVGGILALFLSMGRTSSRRWLSTPLALFTFVFRGTPLYVQLLIIYMYSY